MHLRFRQVILQKKCRLSCCFPVSPPLYPQRRKEFPQCHAGISAKKGRKFDVSARTEAQDSRFCPVNSRMRWRLVRIRLRPPPPFPEIPAPQIVPMLRLSGISGAILLDPSLWRVASTSCFCRDAPVPPKLPFSVDGRASAAASPHSAYRERVEALDRACPSRPGHLADAGRFLSSSGNQNPCCVNLWM